jgi:hypothetical protein
MVASPSLERQKNSGCDTLAKQQTLPTISDEARGTPRYATSPRKLCLVVEDCTRRFLNTGAPRRLLMNRACSGPPAGNRINMDNQQHQPVGPWNHYFEVVPDFSKEGHEAQWSMTLQLSASQLHGDLRKLDTHPPIRLLERNRTYEVTSEPSYCRGSTSMWALMTESYLRALLPH